MTALTAYDRACLALVEARRELAQAAQITDFKAVRFRIDQLKVQARHIRDRILLADAAELQMRAERKLGELLDQASAAGALAGRGRPKKGGDPEPISDEAGALDKCSEEEHFPPVTLDELGLERKHAMIARKQASIAEQAFEAMVAATRERVIAGRAKIIEGGTPINGAASVMAGRAEPSDSLDYFPTPPWATRALVQHVLPQLGLHYGAAAKLRQASAWEPACGEGHIAEVLAETFGKVRASDVHPYGYGETGDFLKLQHEADWIITNPPFGDLAEQFCLRALELARTGVALFVRAQWLEGVERYRTIFQPTPPALIAYFAERVPLCKGRWDPNGSTATQYVWLVWLKNHGPKPPRAIWIEPGRREALERPDDRTRFTAKPVTRKEQLPPHDPDTGELVEKPSRPTPVDDASLEIPAFLRRAPVEAAQ